MCLFTLVFIVTPSDEVTISAAFDNFDADGSGKIDTKELGALAEDLGFPFASKAELAAAVQALDQDHSGQIDKVMQAAGLAREGRLGHVCVHGLGGGGGLRWAIVMEKP
jgi:hypothetical protein